MLIYDDPKIKNTEQKPIRAYDLKCSENQTDRMQNVGKDVVNRLYYTQFALFFFFFIYKRSLSTQNFKNQSVIAMLIPLLLGSFWNFSAFFYRVS